MSDACCRTCHIPLTRENSFFGWGQCKVHYACDDCGIRENLCYYREGLLCDPCHSKRVAKRIRAYKGRPICTNEITCPYCGYEFSDSWEHSDGEQECPDCERKFEVERNTSITYSSAKKEVKASPLCGKTAGCPKPTNI